MSKSREEAVQIVSDFFEVRGAFGTCRPEGMAGSLYPKAFTRFVQDFDEESQGQIGRVLLEYALDGSHAYGQASAYVLAEMALRGLTATVVPHVVDIRKWFENGLEMGWWTTDANYEVAPREAQNAVLLMNALWCCDEDVANELTESFLKHTSSQKLRISLMKSKLLPQIRKSVTGFDP